MVVGAAHVVVGFLEPDRSDSRAGGHDPHARLGEAACSVEWESVGVVVAAADRQIAWCKAGCPADRDRQLVVVDIG